MRFNIPRRGVVETEVPLRRDLVLMYRKAVDDVLQLVRLKSHTALGL